LPADSAAEIDRSFDRSLREFGFSVIAHIAKLILQHASGTTSAARTRLSGYFPFALGFALVLIVRIFYLSIYLFIFFRMRVSTLVIREFGVYRFSSSA